MSRRLRLATSSVLAACLALTQAGSSVAGAGATIECGQLVAYLAPDPSGPTPGSISIGLLTPWEIVPTATVSANAAAALPTIVNAGPTCVSMDLDVDGKITSLDFAASGTITGGVAFDSGSGFYTFADRLIVPTFITDTYPGIAALFVTSYQAGTQLSVTFSVDVTTGAFTGFDGQAAFCGKAGVANSGDGEVGDARIPAAVLQPADVAALQTESGLNVCATVHAVGTIVPDSRGQIDVQTDVVITAEEAPPPPPTSTAEVTAMIGAGGSPAQLLILVLSLAILALVRRLSSSGQRRG